MKGVWVYKKREICDVSNRSVKKSVWWFSLPDGFILFIMEYIFI